MMIGLVQLGTSRGMLEMTIGSRKMTPPRMVRMGAVGGPPHLLQAELGHPGLVRGDRGALDADAMALDGVRGVDRDLIVRRVAVLHGKVVVLQLDIQVGQDQPVLDVLPDDPRHLVAVEFDDGIGYLDLGHVLPRSLSCPIWLLLMAAMPRPRAPRRRAPQSPPRPVFCSATPAARRSAAAGPAGPARRPAPRHPPARRPGPRAARPARRRPARRPRPPARSGTAPRPRSGTLVSPRPVGAAGGPRGGRVAARRRLLAALLAAVHAVDQRCEHRRSPAYSPCTCLPAFPQGSLPGTGPALGRGHASLRDGAPRDGAFREAPSLRDDIL